VRGWSLLLIGLMACGGSSASDGLESSSTTAEGSSSAATSTTDPGESTGSTSSTADSTSSGTTGASSSTGPTETRVLQHFGFVGVSCMVDDPHDRTGPRNYVDEVASFTNVAHLCPLDIDIAGQMEELQLAELQAFIDLTLILFEQVPGETHPENPNPMRLQLREDAATVFATFVGTNEGLLTPEHVAAFYLIDEPIWNGTTPEELATAATLVDDAFPDIPIAVVEAYPAVDAAEFPSGVDWVGFDRYGVPDPSTDAAYLAELETVRSRASEAQDLILILDAQWFPEFEVVAGLTPEDMGDVALHTLELAQSRDDVVAIIGYTWPGGLDIPEQLGARSLPKPVHDAYRFIGETVVSPE